MPGFVAKQGAQAHNRNAVRHGLLAGALPKGCSYIAQASNFARGELEKAVQAARGKVTLADAATIQTVLRWERHAMLAGRWLRRSFDELTHDQRLYFSREVARASAERDKAIDRLKLDAEAPWGSLFGDPMADPGPLSIGGPDASAGLVGAQAGSDFEPSLDLIEGASTG